MQMCKHTPNIRPILTEVSWVVVGGAVQAQVLQVGDEIGNCALVYTLTLTEDVQLGGEERREEERRGEKRREEREENQNEEGDGSGGRGGWKRKEGKRGRRDGGREGERGRGRDGRRNTAREGRETERISDRDGKPPNTVKAMNYACRADTTTAMDRQTC